MKTCLRRALLTCLPLAVSACWFDGELKQDTGVIPENLDDGWETATPEAVGLDALALAGIHAELLREDRYRGALSLLVVKDGKLVWETYLRRRADQSEYRPIQSVTKSVTSLLLGIARDRGSIPSLELTLGELFPEQLAGSDPRKASITLHQLLTMTSGIAFDNEDFSGEMWVEKPADPIGHMLGKPLYADPGTRFYYRDVDPQLVGYALTRLTGQTEAQLAAETLFRTLDIHDYYWEAGPDGVSMAAHGLQLLPRDLAKLGQMVLDRGVWRGERVVSEEWLALSTTEQVLTDRDYSGGVFPYGYYWWVVPDVGFAAWGHGGQFILVVPAQRMVVVQTAFPDTDFDDAALDTFLALVRPLL